MAAKRFGIVCSTFNEPYVGSLLEHTLAGLGGQACDVVRVPGSFEIPLQVQRLAASKKYGAVIALGIIWQGKTAHASEILRAATDALMRIGLEHDVPVIHQILSVASEKEAKKRTSGKKLNRGREAAEAALAVLAAGPKAAPRRVRKKGVAPKVAPTKAKAVRKKVTAKKARPRPRQMSKKAAANGGA
ncbi:MAG: 6,7-dimethyl-8-ribityllumazine synthase [Verrucomicrobiota bacterium]